MVVKANHYTLGDNFREGLADKEIKELEESVQPVRSMLVKLQKFAFAVKNSSTILLPEWYRILTTYCLRARIMPRNVSTRWNLTHDMLSFTAEYRPAIDSMTAARDLGLRKYKLDQAEWKIVGELQDVLKIYKDATLFFLRGTPNLATVIPAMDHIDNFLATSAERQYSPAIRAALAIGKKTINKYYNMTDHSEVYRIAMILHPCHKLEYFKKHNWEATWIETAGQVVCDKFDRSYATMDANTNEDSMQVDTDEGASSEARNIFDNLPDLAPAALEFRDKLECFLATAVEDVKDALKWWFDRRASFPHLSCMARNYLSIPATTVGVERVFSQGLLILPHVCNRLNGQSTRALMCIGAWSGLGLVKDVDIKGVLGDEINGEMLATGVAL